MRTTGQRVTGKPCKAVLRAVVAFAIFFAGLLAWSGFTKSYTYHNVNGHVWLSEQPLLAKWIEMKPQVFHCLWNGEVHKGQQRTPINGLVTWPSCYVEIPQGVDPYQWKPPAELVKVKLKEKYPSYEAVSFWAARWGADTNQLAGETRVEAHERLLEFMAQTFYCSFGEYAGRARLSSARR